MTRSVLNPHAKAEPNEEPSPGIKKRDQYKIAVLGAGAWGTALAIAFARSGAHIQLWGRNETQIRRMTKSRRNERYLPNGTLDANIHPTHILSAAVKDADAVFIVVPSSAFGDITERISEYVSDGTPVISCTKGLDPAHNTLLTENIIRNIPQAAPLYLSGPSFASEVADEHPTSVLLAGDFQIACELAAKTGSETFHIQPDADMVGAQVGGLLKNVVAIACGMSDGLGFGSNTRAAIMARGLEEAANLADALGGEAKTLLGVAGAGDLALTCTDPQSRNYSFGQSLADPTKDLKAKTFEGAASVQNACRLMREHGLEANISFAVLDVLSGEITPKEFVPTLFSIPATTPEQAQIAS